MGNSEFFMDMEVGKKKKNKKLNNNLLVRREPEIPELIILH